jgi:hypothetical protein
MFYRCKKVQLKPINIQVRDQIQRSKRNLSVLRNGAPDCPVHQDRTTQTSHSRVFGDAFHYNSPDCLVSQRATALQRQRSTLTREQCANSVRQKSEQKSEVHRTVSGVAPDCPVSHEDKASNGQLLSNPNGWVTWRHTGLSGGAPDCPVRPSTAAFPNGLLVVEGYKYPQPPQLQASKSSKDFIQYKS